MPTIVLASTSKFRQKILADAGIEAMTMASDCDESAITAASPQHLAMARASAKARAVLARAPQNSVVIGADQVLGFQGKAWDKAASAEEATHHLQTLSGHTHILHSAYSLWRKDHHTTSELVTRSVDINMTMRKLTAQEIAAYIATNEWQGCVGCYQYEHRGVHLFSAIGGYHTAIIGLPLIEMLQDLRTAGINLLL